MMKAIIGRRAWLTRKRWPLSWPRLLPWTPCGGDALEVGQQRIALYATANGVPSHAARQLPDGRWTSKLGRWEDIEHRLPALEGESYGAVVQIMKRSMSP
jgi:hypothetical protein